MQVVLTTEGVEPRDRLEYWTTWGSSIFAPLQHEPVAGSGFWGTIWARELGPVGISRIAAAAHEVRRGPQQIAADDPELVWLVLQLAGSTSIARGTRTAVLTPGDMTVYDSSHPYEIRSPGPIDIAVYQFPRRLLRLSEHTFDKVACVRVSGGHGQSDLVAPFLMKLASRLQVGALPNAGEDLGEAVLNLVRVVFAGPDPRQQGPARSSAPLLPIIKAYIERELADPALTPRLIADHHHISLRYLYVLFEGEGRGVSEWIRDRRLERCRQDLQDPNLQWLRISAIAERWGFLSASHFSRAFRAVYGRAPGAFRVRTEEEPG